MIAMLSRLATSKLNGSVAAQSNVLAFQPTLGTTLLGEGLPVFFAIFSNDNSPLIAISDQFNRARKQVSSPISAWGERSLALLGGARFNYRQYRHHTLVARVVESNRSLEGATRVASGTGGDHG